MQFFRIIQFLMKLVNSEYIKEFFGDETDGAMVTEKHLFDLSDSDDDDEVDQVCPYEEDLVHEDD